MESGVIGKTVLVTGAAKRVGCFIARELHAAGANIVVHYRSAETGRFVKENFAKTHPKTTEKEHNRPPPKKNR